MSQPCAVAYYYKIRWGCEREFKELYLKNHYPLMMAQKASGRILDLKLYQPKFHGDGRADWTYMVVITFASWEAVGASVDEDALAQKLYPDFETYRREERRRFEIVEAHWDVPLKEAPLPA